MSKLTTKDEVIFQILALVSAVAAFFTLFSLPGIFLIYKEGGFTFSDIAIVLMAALYTGVLFAQSAGFVMMKKWLFPVMVAGIILQLIRVATLYGIAHSMDLVAPVTSSTFVIMAVSVAAAGFVYSVKGYLEE